MSKLIEQNAEVYNEIVNSGKSLLQLYLEAKKELNRYNNDGGMGK